MTTISEFMQHNHRQCDELYAAAEEAVANQDWDAATEGWQAFTSELNTHITEREEALLFPALEAANGPPGPIAVMRGEHEQMRALIAQMSKPSGRGVFYEDERPLPGNDSTYPYTLSIF